MCLSELTGLVDKTYKVNRPHVNSHGIHEKHACANEEMVKELALKDYLV